MNEALNQLLALAHSNPKVRQQLLDTQSAVDPTDAFCALATELGFPITVGELFTINQTLCDNLLKSTNGGATYPIEDWADAYELFISSL